MGEVESAHLSSPFLFEDDLERKALVHAIAALAEQHCISTGLANRVLDTLSGAASSTSATVPWPGFEHVHASRELMRSCESVTLDVLRCHTLLALYLMRGNAFREAYNFLCIAVRKCYIGRIHRVPTPELPEQEKTAQMQLWWTIFSLDLICSLQLNMPAACQKSIITCPRPRRCSLARYVSPANQHDKTGTYTFSTYPAGLAVVVTDFCAAVSTADLSDDHSADQVVIRRRANDLSSALLTLESWMLHLPTEYTINYQTEGFPMQVMIKQQMLPIWQQQQAVVLALQSHNAYMLITRPYINFRHKLSEVADVHAQQPEIDIHITSAVRHASTIITTVFT